VFDKGFARKDQIFDAYNVKKKSNNKNEKIKNFLENKIKSKLKNNGLKIVNEINENDLAYESDACQHNN